MYLELRSFKEAEAMHIKYVVKSFMWYNAENVLKDGETPLMHSVSFY